MAVQLGVFAAALVCPLDFVRDGGKMTVGLDGQVAIKLLVSGYCFVIAVWGVLSLPSLRRILVSIPAIMVISLLLLAIPSAFSGLSSSALPAALINLAFLVFVPTSLVTIGLVRFIQLVTAAVAVAMILAWTLYIFVPSYGVFPELMPNGQIVERLGGAGHPNSVARLAAIGLIGALYLMIYRKMPKSVIVPVLILFLVSLVFAQSRTAMIGAAFGASLICWKRFVSLAGLAIASVGIAGFLAVLMLTIANGEDQRLGDRFIAKFTKTGNAEELTSGTGRTEIWGKAIELIAEKPLTGLGFGAASILMVDHSQSTHNTVLHGAMIAGVGGGILMLLLQFWLLMVVIFKKEPLVRAVGAFVLLSGQFEDTVLATFPGPASMLWTLAILYPVFTAVTGLDDSDRLPAD